jgi:hypothetical protein
MADHVPHLETSKIGLRFSIRIRQWHHGIYVERSMIIIPAATIFPPHTFVRKLEILSVKVIQIEEEKGLHQNNVRLVVARLYAIVRSVHHSLYTLALALDILQVHPNIGTN